ncbi:MAG: hypothetical protein EBR83_05005 [Verrucomicrobia bacterium]|nr:hypothetical protein [Verrucomicrobiota bacterium]
MRSVGDRRQMGAGDAVEAAAPLLLTGLIFGLRQGAPSIVVREGGDAQPTFVQHPALSILVIIRDTDHAGTRVDQLLGGTVGEAFVVAEEDDGVRPAEAGEGRRLVGRDGLGITEAADGRSPGSRFRIGAQAHRLDGAGRGIHGLGGDLGAIVEDERGGATGAHLDLRHPALHAALHAMLAATIGEQTDDLADADERPGEAFAEKRAPHHGELGDFDVILERAAVEAGRQEQHVAQQRVAEAFVEQRPGRAAMGLERGLVVATRGRSPEEDFNYSASRPGTWRMPLVVVIDGDSASSSEIFAGAIRDHARGTIVGSRSYGKGSIQGIFPLEGAGVGMRLTTAKYYTPSGVSIHEKGIAPHVDVVMTPEEDSKLRRQRSRPDIVDAKEFKERFGFEPIVDRQLQAAVAVFRAFGGGWQVPQQGTP